MSCTSGVVQKKVYEDLDTITAVVKAMNFLKHITEVNLQLELALEWLDFYSIAVLNPMSPGFINAKREV